jgi:hypothetical protein
MEVEGARNPNIKGGSAVAASPTSICIPVSLAIHWFVIHPWKRRPGLGCLKFDSQVDCLCCVSHSSIAAASTHSIKT